MRKIITLGVLLILATSLLGCNKVTLDNNEKKELDTEAVEMNIHHQKLNNRYEAVAYISGHLYGGYVNSEGGVIVYENLETGQIEQEYKINQATAIVSISLSNNGILCVCGVKNDEVTMWTIDSQGNVIENEQSSNDELGEDWGTEIKGFFADDNNHFFLWYITAFSTKELYGDSEDNVYSDVHRIFVKDTNMSTICYDQVLCRYDSILDVFVDDNGNAMIFGEDEEGLYKRKIITSPGEKPQKERIDMETDLYGYNNVCLVDDGLLHTRWGEIKKYSTKDDTESTLITLAEAGIFEDEIISMNMTGDVLRIVDNHRGEENSEITIIEKGKSERQVLKLGTMFLSEELKKGITSFNRSQNSIQIVPVVYDENYDIEKGRTQLLLDISAGTAPDILSTGELGYDEMAGKGLYEDLYKYLDDDSELGRDDLIPTVKNAYEIDGKLYSLGTNINLYTMWGGESVVGETEKIDFKGLANLVERNGRDINSIYGLATGDESALTALTAMQLSDFIDWGKGECSFNTGEFYDILSFLKGFKGAGTSVDHGLVESIHDKSILLCAGPITSVADLTLHREIFGEDVKYVGYPSTDEVGHAASMLNNLAINSQSDNKDAAWEFIKYLVMECNDQPGFPVYVKAFEDRLQESLETEYFNEYGYEEKAIKACYSDNDNFLSVYAAEPCDVDMIRKLINETNKKCEYNMHIQGIIEEEAQAFFEDQKSVEQVAFLIQNRVNTYLQENMN